MLNVSNNSAKSINTYLHCMFFPLKPATHPGQYPPMMSHTPFRQFLGQGREQYVP